MKKIFAISLIAMSAVTAANAQIASKAYVDTQTGTLGSLTTTAKTNLVAAINEVKASASGDVSGLDSRLDTLEAGDKTEGSVDYKIATALKDYTETGADTTYAKQSDFTTLQSAVNNASTGLAATKAIADANATAIAALDDTYATDTALTDGLATKQATANMITATEGEGYTGKKSSTTEYPSMATAVQIAADAVTTAGVGNQISTAIGALDTDGALGGTNNVIYTITETDGFVSVTSGKVGNDQVADNAAIADSKIAKTGTIAANDGNIPTGGAVYTAINDLATGAVATNTANIATLNGDAETVGSVNNKIATAQSTLQSAINGRVEANSLINASSNPSIVMFDAKGLVTNGWEAGVLASKNTIVNNDVASNAGIEMSKIAMPTTIADGSEVEWGTYSLTADVGQNGITYKWELIQRAQ